MTLKICGEARSNSARTLTSRSAADETWSASSSQKPYRKGELLRAAATSSPVSTEERMGDTRSARASVLTRPKAEALDEDT
jgi:hypothetical protein